MSVSMDFITQLPQVQGYNGIMVVVDRFSKYVVFVPTKMPCGAERTAKLFFKNIVKYWGGAIKPYVGPSSAFYMQILDHIVQVSRDRVVDEFELPSADRWVDRAYQRIAGGLLETLCHG